MADMLLGQLPLFSKLPAAILTALAESVGRRLISAGEVLFRQGEPGVECFAILSGQLEVITYVGDAELRLDIYSPGQIIGEMALIDQSPRSATVRALADSDLVVLGEQAFKMLIGSNPDLAMSLLRSGSTRTRNTNQRMIAALERKNAELLAAYQQLQAAQAELIRLSRFEEELAVARRIQEWFLPRRLPQPEGWQVAGYSRGAQAVGGDFYDCIELNDGGIGLVVADACGKGITAALFVALTRSLLRAASQAPMIFQGAPVRDAESTLTGALWMVNDYICREHADNNMFVTLFYGVLDPQNGALAYVNAGHNPPVVVSPRASRITETELGGIPIGILPTQSYAVKHLSLEPGERLVAFSDGITEAISPADELFGDERLHANIRSGSHLSTHELVASIIAAVDGFAAATPQADDMTLLIVSRL